MEQVLKRLTEAAQDPPMPNQYGMGPKHRVVQKQDLRSLLEDYYKIDTKARKDYSKIRELEQELNELRASVFIPLKSL